MKLVSGTEVSVTGGPAEVTPGANEPLSSHFASVGRDETDVLVSAFLRAPLYCIRSYDRLRTRGSGDDCVLTETIGSANLTLRSQAWSSFTLSCSPNCGALVDTDNVANLALEPRV